MDELDEPISDSIIREALPGIKILTYDELSNFLDFDEKGRLVLLYLTGENYGHWVCLFKNNEIITFHDSYGFNPDSQLKKSKMCNTDAHENVTTVIIFSCTPRDSWPSL